MDLNNYYNVNKIGDILGISVDNFRRHYEHNDFFKTLIIKDRNAYVSKEEIDRIKSEVRDYEEMKDFYYVEEASKILSIHSETLLRKIKNGDFPNAIKTMFYNSKWKIPNKDIEEYMIKKPKKPKKEMKSIEPKINDVKFIDKFNIKDYFDITIACKMIELKKFTFMNTYRGNGFFKTLVSYKDDYYISKEEILSLQEKQNYYKNLEDCFSINEIAEMTGISSDYLLLNVKEIFPKACRGIYKSKWKVSRVDVDEYISSLGMSKINITDPMISKKIIDINPEDFNRNNYNTIKEIADKFNVEEGPVRKLITDNKVAAVKYKLVVYILKSEIDKLNLSDILVRPRKESNIKERWEFYENKYLALDTVPKTVSLYEEYYFLKINRSNYSDKMGHCQRLLLDGLNLLQQLNKELYLYSDSEFMEIISKNYDSSHIKNNIAFINYVRTKVKECSYKSKYNFTSKIKRETDKEIYSKKDFKDMYLYTKNIDLHIKKALEDVIYAESWFYVTMHFIDTWRSMDIIEFPCTKYNNIKPLDREYLLNNRLTINESQEIINIIRERNAFKINKTGALNKFLVNRDMLITIATAILILEYHYKDTETEILMPYFKRKKVLQKNINMFFGEKFIHISFNNRIANRTLLSYFHYNVTKSSKNGDIAHLLSTRMRGHIKEDTVSQYVMNINEDDFFDDISYHLFNRGHFGWLFNSLLEISISSKTKELTINEKTLIIEKYQNYYSPKSMEEVGKFLLSKQNENHSIALEIASIPNKEIIERLESVFKGYMPSKEEEGQCIYSKSCKEPYGDCKTCHYLIPKIYLLNSLKVDIDTIIQELENVEEYKMPERIKLTAILFKLIGLLNQSVVEFGKEYISTFLSIDNLKFRLAGINNKMLTPGIRG